MRERDRQTDRQTEIERQGQTDRQTDRDRQTNRERERREGVGSQAVRVSRWVGVRVSEYVG